MAITTGTWCKRHRPYASGYYWVFNICLRQDKSNVYVSVDAQIPGNYGSVNWVMSLQRYNPSTKSWKTIGTRKGYVSDYSPSHREFSNVAITGNAIRVEFSPLTTLLKECYSQQIMR